MRTRIGLASFLGLSLMGLLVLVGCGGAGGSNGGGNQGGNPATPQTLSLQVDRTELFAGDEVAVNAEVQGDPDPAVSWAVDGVENGNSTVGSITGSGTAITYTAPEAEGEHILAATSVSDASKSASVSLKIRKATVTLSPATTTVLTGGTVAYYATVSGSANQTITWFVDNVRNGSATVGTLTPNGDGARVLYTASAAGGTHTVKAVATNSTGASVSGSATVAVQVAFVPPAIQSFTATPATITVGQGCILAWSASGTTQLSIAPSVGDVTGSTSRNVSPSSTTTYTITGRNASGQTATASATVTVNAAPAVPVITSQPQGTTVTEGQTAAFSVSATSTTSLGYQWRKNGSAISGATARTYTTPATTIADNGARFSVVVTNSSGSVTSSDAELIVNAASKELVGFGSRATGGAGYTTVHVTNLNDSGAGSFRAALGSNRTIVFDVGGTITLNSELVGSGLVNLTVDGSAAPGSGITFLGRTIIFQSSHNIIITNIRHRAGYNGGSESGGCLTFYPDCYDIVVDHCSFSGFQDEGLDFWHGNHDVTIQNCIMAQGMEGTAHNYPCLVSNAPQNFTIYHNIFANGLERNPAVGYDDVNGTLAPGLCADVVNNLVWKYGSYGITIYWGAKANVIGNYTYCTTHPASSGRAITVDSGGGSIAFSSGNYSKDGSSVTGNGSSAFAVPAYAQVTSTSALVAANYVKGDAGCRVGGLDAVDQAIINDLSF